MGEGKAARAGDDGNSKSIVHRHAEIMNSPSRAASIAYSGQCNRVEESTRPPRRNTNKRTRTEKHNRKRPTQGNPAQPESDNFYLNFALETKRGMDDSQ